MGILKEPEAVSSKAAVQKRVRSREIVTAIVFVRVCAELFADALYRPTAFGQTNGCRSCRWTRALSFSRSPRTSADPGVGIAKLRKRKAGCDSQIENAEKCVTKFESCGGFELPGRKCSARRKPRITARYYLERWVAPKSAALSGWATGTDPRRKDEKLHFASPNVAENIGSWSGISTPMVLQWLPRSGRTGRMSTSPRASGQVV